MLRRIAVCTVGALVCLTARSYASREWNPDQVSVAAAIEFQSQPAQAAGNVKQFTNGTPIAFQGRPTFLNQNNKEILGRITNPRVTLTNQGGTVTLTFDHVSMSGEHEHSGETAWFTGNAQRTTLGEDQGGIRWIIEIYDATPNAQPIYKWDWDAAKRAHEEIQCGVTEPRSFSTVIQSGADIFKRAARIRAIAAPAEWTHC
jgi:hypothetical protein